MTMRKWGPPISDFCAELCEPQSVEVCGLSIEAMAYYLERLPTARKRLRLGVGITGGDVLSSSPGQKDQVNHVPGRFISREHLNTSPELCEESLRGVGCKFEGKCLPTHR